MCPKTTYAYKVAFFSITAKTNLHVGAGGENFWIIDNLVQRDSSTNLPCINASSLKGALREFMRDYLKSNSLKDWVKILFDIFGNDRSDTDLTDEELAKELDVDKEKLRKLNYPGNFRFLQADLLSIPILKEGVIIHKVTCPWLMENFMDKLSLFEHVLTPNINIESICPTHETIDNALFCEKTDDYNLPVIARNHLEDGSSTNLWYEQILPRETVLFFPVLYENDDLFEYFKSAVVSKPVQIGANASIGYGFCKIELISTQFKTTGHDNEKAE